MQITRERKVEEAVKHRDGQRATSRCAILDRR